MNVLARFFRSLRRGTLAARPGSSFRPSLECLKDRFVPATFDLTTAGASAAVGGAIFFQADLQGAGSGALHSFVRLQAHHGAAIEQGYNTDARPLQFDEKRSPVFTHALRLSDIPTVTIDGVAYKEFVLDINQTRSSPTLSLDELRLYVGKNPNLTGYDPASGKLAGLTPVYDLAAGGGNSILLNARLSHGSGSGEMLLYVPASVFAGQAGHFVYLYSQFGGTSAANGGFEEWAVRSSRSAAAPPVSSLSGTVYLDSNGDGSFDNVDLGLANLVVQLTGVNDLGQTVNLTAVTGADGSYSFVGLRAGTYALREVGLVSGPDPYLNGTDNVGTLDGTPSTDLISNIHLSAGVVGRSYNFGETLFAGC